MPIEVGMLQPKEGRVDYFTLPDPEFGEMTSGRLQVRPGVSLYILWAPHHMTETGGAGRLYLKRERVGSVIATANLPERSATGVLADPDTGVTIHVTRE